MSDPALAGRLYEVIAALDRRRPQPQRPGEKAIARAAAELRRKALARLAELEREAAGRQAPACPDGESPITS